MTRAVPVLAAVALLLGALHYPLSGEWGEWAGNLGWTLAALSAVLGCLVAVAGVGDAQRRRAWRALALASGLWLAGQLVWDAYSLADAAPAQPTPADLFWLSFAIVAALGVARLGVRGDAQRRYRALEAATLAVGAGSLVTAFAWQELQKTALSTTGSVTSVAYAVLYVAVFAALLQTLPAGVWRGAHRDLRLLFAGFALQAIAFTWWAPQLLAGTYVPGGSPIDLIWVAGLVLIALAGLAAPASAPGETRSRRASRRQSLLPSALLIVVLATVLIMAVTGAPLGARIVLISAALAMALLLLVRSWLFAGELMTAEEELASYLALAPVMLGAANADGYFVRINPAFTATLGHSAETLTTTPFLDFVHPDDVEDTQLEMEGLLDGHPTAQFRNRYRCADGSYKWLLWSSHLVEEDGLVHAAARDISEIMKLQGDLERSNADLERFAYAASHDLAEPLRTISSFSQLVMRDAADTLTERSLRHLTHVTEGADRMRALIDAMLDYSRAGRRTHRPEPVDLDAVVDSTVATLGAQLDEAGAVVTHDDLPVVTGDPQQLGQLLQNLVSNAVKFRGEEAPRVHLAGRRENGGWHLEVRDNGIGVDERHREQIFAMFERLHSRADYPGTGIGLALCAKIAERHGGRIWVDSEPGRGSTFHVTLHDPGGRRHA